MKIKYIAIEREYGSAGTKIAEETAKKCNISCYGHEIMEAVSKEKDIPVSALEKYEESVSSSFMYSMFVMSQTHTGNPDLLSNEGKLYVDEAQVIKELALNGPAVFVGHCAAGILKDFDGVLRVFIHADDETKHKRIINDYKIPEQDVDSTCRKYNKKRANYYSFCTQKKWDDIKNYDIVLDSSTLGIDGCAAALAAIYLNSK